MNTTIINSLEISHVSTELEFPLLINDLSKNLDTEWQAH